MESRASSPGWTAEKAKRVMQAMLQMDKLDIERLQQVYDQG